MNYKKGAMFGLDARIALAIFGALSVISGAALYSAIQESRVTSVVTGFNEVVKASESYYLDNYKKIPVNISNTMGPLYGGDLLTNRENLSTWKGPYIEGELNSSSSFKNSLSRVVGVESYLTFYVKQKSTWTSNNNLTDENCDSSGSDCSEWIALFAGSASNTAALADLFNLLDEKLDNSDGSLAGNIRYNNASSDFILFKSIYRYI